MQNKEFKVGDTVYIGTLEGKVTEVEDDTITIYPIRVSFSDETEYFTKEGAYLKNSLSILKHFPYELEYKEIIKKDTVVYVKFGLNSTWHIRYYSYYNRKEDKHYVFHGQLKSNETDAANQVEIISLTNPLI